MMRFAGKVAIVTGAASGIGYAVASLLAQEGAKVCIADYSELGEDAARKIIAAGGEALFVRTDVSQEAAVANMVEETVNQFGSIDILFANAGVGEVGMAHELKTEDWQRVIDINLTGVFLCCKYVIPHLQRKKSGSIVLNASILGHVGFPAATAYTAAKGGVILLAKTLALDYAKDGIRVNSVSPAFIRTPMVEAGPAKEMIPQLEQMHPLKRLGLPEEVANCVAFLASEQASFVTGTDLLVDGGYTAQ